MQRQVKRMKFSEAYETCKKIFIKAGYKGVGTIYQTDKAWTFCPFHEEQEYGGAPPIIVMREGTEVRMFIRNPEYIERYIDGATVIS